MSIADFECAEIGFSHELDFYMPTMPERLATLEEKANSHIKFFWGISAVFALWLAGISVILFQINGKLGNLGSNITTLRLPQQIEKASFEPQDPKSQAQALSVIKQAKSTATILPEPVVQRSGMRFIDASRIEPSAWPVALEFVSYRSLLNITYKPTSPIAPLPVGEWKYSIMAKKGNPQPELKMSKWGVPSDQAATFDRIGIDQNSGIPTGPAFMFLVGGVTSLDDMHIRSVIFEGVEVHYTGKPLILENSVFINCTFKIDNNEPGRHLGKIMLASDTINFEKST